MALKDILALIDDKLADTFNLKPYDAEKDREKLVSRIESTREKFLQTEPARGRKDFRVANNVVEYRPTLPNGEPLIVGSKSHPYYLPSERFTDFLDNLVELAKAKSFDDQLESKPEAASSGRRQRSTTPRKPRSDAGAGWSEERRAKFAATVAARKAAKG